MDVLVLIPYLKDVMLEPFAMACLTLQFKVGHELHLNGDCARSLALLAASAFGIEGEMLWCESHLF